MKMENLRKDGSKIYTRVLRKLIAFGEAVAGHCGGDSGSGHCS